MNELEVVRQKIKAKKQGRYFSNNTIHDTNKTNTSQTKTHSYVNNLITRILCTIILLFGCIIFVNSNSKNEKLFKDKVLTENISFTKVSNLYTKYFGNVIPLQNISTDDKTVFNENFTYKEMHDYKEGYAFTVDENYLVPYLESGIIVFIGEKEGYGNTIIVQGIDEVDYWYSNVQNTSVSLYDYITKGTLLGTANGNKLYMTFQKNGEYLSYDEVIKES